MPNLEEVKGLSEARADKFRDDGLTTVDDVATADLDSLTSIKGIGDSTAEGIRDSARDILKDTVDTPSDEESEHSAASEPDVDTSVPDVDVETETGDSETEEASEEFEVGAAETSVEGEDPDGPPYPLTVELETDEQFDYLLFSLIGVRHGRIMATAHQQQAVEDVLDEARSLGGAGEFTVELDEDGLNGLHAALTETQLTYQGTSTGAYSALGAVIDQLKATRSQYL